MFFMCLYMFDALYLKDSFGVIGVPRIFLQWRSRGGGPGQGVWQTEVPKKLKQNVKLAYKFWRFPV